MIDEINAPDEIPAYIRDGIDRQDRDTLRAIAHYATARADRLDQLENQKIETDDVVDDGEELVDVDQDDSSGGTIVEKKIPCGKNCSGCPHGPYRYRAYRDGDKVKTEYLGKA